MLKYFKAQIKDEIEGAKKYAKLAIETKMSHPDWSELFLSMSLAELDHAKKLYKMFTDEIGPLMETFKETPDYICEMFDSVIEYYSENYAEALHLHELYKSEVK